MTVTDNGVRGERALQAGDKDRLGFSEVARRIARSIVDRASAEGLVIGLDGPWGSGKSSLLHLIERSLGELDERERPTIIRFRPWLVGQRDALLVSLFSDLAQGVANVQLDRGDASKDTLLKARQTATAVRKFAYSLSKAGEIVELAGEVWGPLKWLGKGLSKGGKALGLEKKPEPDLVTLKARIINDLRVLNHRFLVTIDDVDRLEPKEVIEVLRLVRSVADFPNIVYLLCYDAERLAEGIEKGANLKSGAAYLEKIIQLTVMIPKPEPFELRQWFAEELGFISGPVSAQVAERLKIVIDQEGGAQLKTPRAVVRTLDSIRFFLPALRDAQIDVADLVWLLLIKDGAPGLYRWIESYSANVAAASFGTATLSEPGKAAKLRELMAVIDEEQLSDVMYRHMFAEHISGVEPSYDTEGDPIAIFQKVDHGERQKAIDGKRLASPDHYRLYFSLIGPTHAVTQAGFDAFWAATEAGSEQTAMVLVDLHSQPAQGSLRKSDVLLERLRTIDISLWSSTKARNLLLAFGRVMDDAFRRQPDEQDFLVTSWDRSERLLPTLFRRVSADGSDAFIDELFGKSPSLGWLTSILRHETFAHGRYGDRKRAAEEWVLSDQQYDRVVGAMLTRYRSMTLREILSVRRAAHVFYAWSQMGDHSGPRELIASSTATDDELFLALLDAFAGTVTSSDRGKYLVLKEDNVDPFMDYSVVKERLAALSSDSRHHVREHARRLLEYTESDKF